MTDNEIAQRLSDLYDRMKDKALTLEEISFIREHLPSYEPVIQGEPYVFNGVKWPCFLENPLHEVLGSKTYHGLRLLLRKYDRPIVEIL